MSIFCSKCGNQVDEKASFCMKCGNAIAAENNTAYGDTQKAENNSFSNNNQTFRNNSYLETHSSESLLSEFLRGSFEGRCPVGRYWVTILSYGAVSFFFVVAVIGIATLLLNLSKSEATLTGGQLSLVICAGAIVFLYFILFLKPVLAINCRRLHDWDMSGWLQFVNLIPSIGNLIFVILMVIPGTPGPNKFGEARKDL